MTIDTKQPYGKWKILSENRRTPSGRVYYNCLCTGCKTIHVVASDNLINKRSKQCRDCAAKERRSDNPNLTARSNPKLYGVWYRLGGPSTGWKTAAEFILWSQAQKPAEGARLARISKRKPHGPENSVYQADATTRHIETIAKLSGKSQKDVQKWAQTVGKKYVAARAKELTQSKRKG